MGIRLTFTAFGSTNITLSCEKRQGIESCKGTKRLIRGSLHSPFQMSPKYFDSNITGTYSPICLTPSNALTWTITQFNYQNIERTLDSPIIGRFLDMSIRNNDLNFEVLCHFLLWSPFNPTKHDRLCWVNPPSPYWDDRPDIGHVWTDIAFNESEFSVVIQQRWFCEDHAYSEA